MKNKNANKCIKCGSDNIWAEHFEADTESA